jgi:hypothetical protein
VDSAASVRRALSGEKPGDRPAAKKGDKHSQAASIMRVIESTAFSCRCPSSGLDARPAAKEEVDADFKGRPDDEDDKGLARCGLERRLPVF